VAVSWSGYFQSLLSAFNIHVPAWLVTDYRSAAQATKQLSTTLGQWGAFPGALLSPDTINLSTLSLLESREVTAMLTAPRFAGLALIFNLPAFCIVALVTWVVLIGIKETARLNASLAIAKIGIILFFLVLGAKYIRPEHWTPFAPNGIQGISSAAAIIFFAYIGFDAVSTAAEETRNPQRDMPIGILASLVVCTVIYVAVAVVLTGMVPWKTLGTAEPLADAFSSLGLKWTASIIALGAVLATTSALIPYQAGQPRIFFSMGRDGLLPKWAARVHPRFRTPYVATLLTGVVVAVCSSVANINELVELTNIGTLFAFALVAAGVIILRRTDPDRPRPFKTPLVPWVPLAAILCCGYLMVQLPAKTWIRFFAWMGAGLVIYFLYGMSRSRVGRDGNGGKGADPASS
jgi:APA family basic amino acid/polyamine antiporter